MIRATVRRVWALLDWRRAAELEWRHRRGAAAMLDESMRRTVATLRVTETIGAHVTFDGGGNEIAYRLGDSDGTRLPEPADGEAVPPPRRTATDKPVVDLDAVMAEPLQEVTIDPSTLKPYGLGRTEGQMEALRRAREASPPPTTRTVDRQTLLRRAREASQGGADYLPPWEGEGL